MGSTFTFENLNVRAVFLTKSIAASLNISFVVIYISVNAQTLRIDKADCEGSCRLPANGACVMRFNTLTAKGGHICSQNQLWFPVDLPRQLQPQFSIAQDRWFDGSWREECLGSV